LVISKVPDVICQLTDLWDGSWLIELSTRGDVLGPLTTEELHAMLDELLSVFKED
jgi:hypothetical protein